MRHTSPAPCACDTRRPRPVHATHVCPTCRRAAKAYLAFAAGFVVCLSMAFSFNVHEPHDPSQHALCRSSTAGLVWLLCFGLKALAVLQVWTPPVLPVLPEPPVLPVLPEPPGPPAPPAPPLL